VEVSRRRVASQVGISEEYLRQIETMGKVPSDEVVIRLAKILGLDVQQAILLAHRDRAPESAKRFFQVLTRPPTSPKSLVSVPVVAYVNALDPFVVDLNAPPIDEIVLTMATLRETSDVSLLYAVRVKGNTMQPLVRDGDDLIARPATIAEVKEADIVIFRDIEGNAWVRMAEVLADEVVFYSLSPLRRPVRRRIDEAVKLDKVIMILRR